jgi:hypothetical protein
MSSSVKASTRCPSRSGVYRALVRGGRVDAAKRTSSGRLSAVGATRRRPGRPTGQAPCDAFSHPGRPMELWQIDVVGGIHLAVGTEAKELSSIPVTVPVRGLGQAGRAGHRPAGV